MHHKKIFHAGEAGDYGGRLASCLNCNHKCRVSLLFFKCDLEICDFSNWFQNIQNFKSASNLLSRLDIFFRPHRCWVFSYGSEVSSTTSQMLLQCSPASQTVGERHSNIGGSWGGSQKINTPIVRKNMLHMARQVEMEYRLFWWFIWVYIRPSQHFPEGV